MKKKKLSANTKRGIRSVVCFVCLIACMIAEKALSGLPVWLMPVLFAVVYLVSGYDVLKKCVVNICHGQIFDENFLMTVASVGAFLLREYAEAAAVMIFYQVGETFQSYAVGKSRNSISSLMTLRPDIARKVTETGTEEVAPEEICVGDVIEVRAGERIPLDGTLTEGSCYLDTSALTGESVPVFAETGSSVLSGSIVSDGVIKVRAEKVFYDSTVSKILDLVENASSKKAKTEQFISVFAKYYTPAVVFSALALAIIPSLFTHEWMKWVGRALTFLVVSCPCALVISVPLGFFGGIGGAGKKGILLKGADMIEQFTKVNTFVFDKTGTLTEGKFSVTKVFPESDREKVLRYAAVCESRSNHPVARSVMAAYGGDIPEGYSVEEIAGHGVKAEKDGEVILAGNLSLMDKFGISVDTVGEGTTVYIAVNGQFVGLIEVEDKIRDDSKRLISELKKEGFRVAMLTGDNEKVAAKVAKELGIEEYKSGLLPADKADEIERIMTDKKEKDVVGFVGDGINDSPVIMRADIGVSMGGIGSDCAIEAADVVLMHDNPSALLDARKISFKTMKIVKENIVFALAVKLAILVLGAFGLMSKWFGIPDMWFAVFADVGVSVIAILNSMRTLNTDRKKKAA